MVRPLRATSIEGELIDRTNVELERLFLLIGASWNCDDADSFQDPTAVTNSL
jgi:hypothetical protein